MSILKRIQWRKHWRFWTRVPYFLTFVFIIFSGSLSSFSQNLLQPKRKESNIEVCMLVM